MGHRNIQFNNHMIDLQADQGHHSYLHPEPCIVYTNVPNYPHQNMNFHPIPERHENPLFYAMPPYNNSVQSLQNLDLNVAPPPSGHYNNNNNSYLTPPVNHGAHNIISYADGVRRQFKRKNAEGTSSSYPYQNASAGPSSSVGPMVARPTESDFITQTDATASFMPPESMVESGSLRSVRNRAGMVGPDSVLAHNANVIRGNYVAPPVQLPGNSWLDMNFSANNGDMGAPAWAQPPNLPYVHANVNGGAGFLHPTPPMQPMQGVRGYNVNHLSHQMATSSRGIPMIRYSNASVDPFQDIVDAGLAFVAPVPPTGFQMYRPHHRGEIVLDPNARHRSFPHLRVLLEDEVAMLEIPGYHVAGELIDQHIDMRLDIDHMSYEELLALGEQMGSVGIGLSDEFIQHYLRIRTFTSGPACINLEVAPCPDQETTDFCVVCQTDYEYEESIGMLDCGHEYHRECIKKWLVVKNTCPVCKSTALRGKGKDLEITI